MIHADTIKALSSPEPAGPRVSIYLPAGEVAARANPTGPIRLKNHVQAASERLQASGMGRREAAALLEPASGRVEDADFWREEARAARGLAFFLGPGEPRMLLTGRAGLDALHVGYRYRLKPLFAELEDACLHVLALSQKHVELFRCTRGEFTPVPVEGLPRSLEDALGAELEPQHLQHHSGARGKEQSGRAAIYHGQGGGSDDVKDELRRFCRAVDEALGAALPADARVVLATTEPLASAYRGVSRLPGLVDQTIGGSPDGQPLPALRRAAEQRRETVVARRREDLLAQCRRRLEADGAASAELTTLLAAAHEGRMDTLVVAVDREVPGAYDAARFRLLAVEEVADPLAVDDLLDVCAAQTFRHAGTVVSVPAAEVPGSSGAAGVFRY